MYRKSRRAFIVGAAALTFTTTLGKPKHKKGQRPQRARTPEPEKLMAWVASMQVHGATHADWNPSALLEMIDNGQRIACRCGTVAAVGILVAQRAGYQARLVGCVTHEAFVGNDGHVMLEVREGEAWTLYDLDGNRKAPKGAGIADQCDGSRQWDTIAHDQVCLTECEIVSDLPTFDARVFGTAWIERDDGWKVFHDDAYRAHVESLGFRSVDAEEWAALV